ncbi:hypothetical protein BC936DRAFT_138027 [Jimgerdemannia flammicorona]|uniref:Uncharacterized protein n=1 Tax=Jimgerdemannia flammicorona TaxID=994334 RepID=A0A433CWA7_9FUNG|nr:hypothetical protein BC936DRAFT_138027 [Jimgerdemannia flammicorona]
MWIISRVFGESRYTRLTFITTLIQCLTVITFEAIIYVYHTQEVNVLSTEQFNNTNGVEYANARSLSVYHILFMIAQLFMVGMFIDAIYQKNTIQLIALVCFEFGMTIYSGIQYRQAATLFDNAAAKATIIAIIEAKLGMFHQSYWAELMVVATMVVFMLIFTAFAYKLYQEFGWSIYKKIGADLAMRDVYKMYQIFMMLLKFDVFFFLSLSIQYLVVLVVRGNTAGANFNLSSLLIKHILLSTIVTVVMMVLAFWGLKSERRTVLYSFMVCGVCSMAYFIYLLVDVNNNPDFYEGSRTFLTFFCKLFFLLLGEEGEETKSLAVDGDSGCLSAFSWSDFSEN